MAFGSGMSEAVYLGSETSFKVLPGTVNAYKLPAKPRITPNVNQFKSTALTGKPDPRIVFTGKQGVDVAFDLECNRKSLAPVLKALFGGTIQTQGTTPFFDHYFSLGDLASWFMEDRHTDVSQNLEWGGCYIGGIDLNIAAEGLMTAAFTGMGAFQTDEGASTVINGTITDCTGDLPLNYLIASIKQGGAAITYLQSLTLRLNRALDKRGHIDGSPQIGVIFGQIAELSGTLVASFQDKALLDLALAGTETSLSVFIPELNSGYGLSVIVPSLILRPAAPTSAGTGLNDITFNWDGYGRVGQAAELLGKYLGTATIPTLSTKTLVVAGDAGADETFTFTATEEQGLSFVVTKINATSIRVTASVENGRLNVQSKTVGTTSSVKIQAGSTGAALLGMTTGVVYAGFSGKAPIARLSTDLATIT